MAFKHLVSVAAALLLATVSDARFAKFRTNGGDLDHPVLKGSCSLCLFKDDTNSWCFYQTSPMITIGFDYDQQFSSISNNEYY